MNAFIESNLSKVSVIPWQLLTALTLLILACPAIACEPGAPVVWPPADWVPPRNAALTFIKGSHIAQINTIHDEEE